MRTAFHEQLDALNEGIAVLCERTGAMIQLATDALLHADVEAAEHVIDHRDDIDHACAAREADAFVILARQAPVARDLRAVVSAMRNVADLQRMGTLAAHVAQISRRRHPQTAAPADVLGYFAEMGAIAARLADDTRSVVLEADSDRAAQLAADDEAMDDIHRRLFTVVMDPGWPHGTIAAVDVTLLSRYYERFADHAVEIAQRVIYQRTGKRQD
ncbi:phosphate transport system regulatory protein PhoU [Mycobacterium sp. CBMA 234]|uniref:phosphate signaling complex protein PhoU n=1 Tax=Mycolicibacterium sp. CBMA 234 TaxID=1918495 RepID=UPI0012DF6F59|nr:phosphate signaling complex protein PhoU [Mycolicibacterium sp. CBMA 234]MUL66052.1 phosphate transport system regulatory protein PhoU [Mycolicibacterium sp. CBMA 234]